MSPKTGDKKARQAVHNLIILLYKDVGKCQTKIIVLSKNEFNLQKIKKYEKILKVGSF